MIAVPRGVLDTLRKIPNHSLKTVAFIGVFAVFFLSGEGIVAPKDFYALESDIPPAPPAVSSAYYPYTPQPDWNKAYTYLQTVRKPDDLIISSNPVFTKIFLNEPGYWIQYDYQGGNNRDDYNVTGDHELYVNAQVIPKLKELKELMANKHGYIVLDYMATDKRIDQDIVDYIFKQMEPTFYDQHGLTSQIWVYKF